MRDILGKIMGILWNIIVQSCGIYLTKQRGVLGETMGYVMGYNWQNILIIGYRK